MKNKLKIGICGYGNLGRGVDSEIAKNRDMELAAIFTRRKPGELARAGSGARAPVVSVQSAAEWKDRVDVVIMCGGSANDLPVQGEEFAKIFNTVDSYDNHSKILDYYQSIDEAAKSGGNISIVSAGWDPGVFSLLRLYMSAILPNGRPYTFWGKGVSQGHSGAIRGIEGVKNAIQYTLPDESAMELIRKGERPELSARQRQSRLCYVVAEEGADTGRIEREIKQMPAYFADYDTTVHFISGDELAANHSKMAHGGSVIYAGETGYGNKQVIELSLKLDSNPEYTASIMLAYARAAHRLSANGESGARTVFDIPMSLLSAAGRDEIITAIL